MFLTYFKARCTLRLNGSQCYPHSCIFLSKLSIFIHEYRTHKYSVNKHLQLVCTGASLLECTSPTSAVGRVDMIIGPMFSGKTTELIKRVVALEVSSQTKQCHFHCQLRPDQRTWAPIPCHLPTLNPHPNLGFNLQAKGVKVATIKSDKDDRYKKTFVVTHDGVEKVRTGARTICFQICFIDLIFFLSYVFSKLLSYVFTIYCAKYCGGECAAGVLRHPVSDQT